MATIPTTEAVIAMIYQHVRQNGWNPRPGEVAFNQTQLQIDLQRQGVREDYLLQALQKLAEDGEFLPGEARWKLTEKGFSRL